jgi:hypothetical protein
MMDDGWLMMDDWWWRMADGDLAALLGGLGAILQRLEASWSGLGLVLGRSWGDLAAILGGVGAILKRLAASWGVVKRSWNVFGEVLGWSCGDLGRSWRDLEVSWIVVSFWKWLKRLPWFYSFWRNRFFSMRFDSMLRFARWPRTPRKKDDSLSYCDKISIFFSSPSLRGH